jgi:hypothetical protein
MRKSNTMLCPRRPIGDRFELQACNCTSQVAERLRNLQPGDCYPQNKSPLFNKFPGEIRNSIFDFALSENDSDPINREAFFYRPDYPAFREISTSLLQTCRLVFLETRGVVSRKVQTVRFWLGSPGRAPDRVLSHRARAGQAPMGMDYRIQKLYEPNMWFIGHGMERLHYTGTESLGDDDSDEEIWSDTMLRNHEYNPYHSDIFENSNEDGMLDLLFGKFMQIFQIQECDRHSAFH